VRLACCSAHKERIALLLAVVADVDPSVALLLNDRAHRLAADASDLVLVDRLAGGTRRIEPNQVARPRQAAGVGGENSIRTALHRIRLRIIRGA
jgi:hypothetical protein